MGRLAPPRDWPAFLFRPSATCGWRLRFRDCHRAGWSLGSRRNLDHARRALQSLAAAGVGNSARPTGLPPRTGRANTMSHAQPAEVPAVPA